MVHDVTIWQYLAALCLFGSIGALAHVCRAYSSPEVLPKSRHVVPNLGSHR